VQHTMKSIAEAKRTKQTTLAFDIFTICVDTSVALAEIYTSTLR